MSMEDKDDYKPDDDRQAARPYDELSSSHIGKQLKTMYDEVVSEPVPEKFMDLLANLEKAEKGRSHD